MSQDQKSYGQILKSSSIVGGSQGVALLIGLIQTKCVAVFLGPVGVGLSGAFGSLIGIVVTLCGLGVSSSAVRSIAKANASEEKGDLGKLVTTLRILSWITGLVGSAVVLLFAKPLSRMTFGSEEYWIALSVLSLCVLFRCLKNGQLGYIQGIRRIGDLAKMKIIASITGVTIGVGLYAWLGLRGIVPAIFAMGLVQLIAANYFARRAQSPTSSVSREEFLKISGDFIKLGVVLMWTGLLSMLVGYLTRVILIQHIDLHAAGLYQSSYRISAMFVGFILAAMSADFLPRLSEVADDDKKIQQQVNEQTEIGLLLAVPGILATITFTSWIIAILYTSEFKMAEELMKWMVLGCLGRVISWPMAMILIAKGCKAWLMVLESCASVLHVALIYAGVQQFGVVGASYAFALLYVVYIIATKLIANKVVGFAWSSEVVKMLLLYLPAVLFLVSLSFVVGQWLFMTVGCVLTLVIGIYNVRQLSMRLPRGHKINTYLSKVPLMNRTFLKRGDE